MSNPSKYSSNNIVNCSVVLSLISDILTVADLSLEDKLEECFCYCPVLLENISTVFVSLGKDGVLVGQRDNNMINMEHYAAAPDHLVPVSVVNASGAGDR